MNKKTPHARMAKLAKKSAKPTQRPAWKTASAKKPTTAAKPTKTVMDKKTDNKTTADEKTIFLWGKNYVPGDEDTIPLSTFTNAVLHEKA